MLVLGLVDVPLWLLLLAAISLLLYLYGTRTHGTFKGTGIPGPKPLPFLGNFVGMVKETLMDYDTNLKKKYGKVVSNFSGSTPGIVIFDKEMISQVMVKQFPNFQNRQLLRNGDPIFESMLTQIEDEQWKHVRSTMSPTFTTGRLRQEILNEFEEQGYYFQQKKKCNSVKFVFIWKSSCMPFYCSLFHNLNDSVWMEMTPEINRCGKQLVSSLASTDGPFETSEYVGRYTMDVIASTAFGLRIDSQTDKDSLFMKHAKKIMDVPIIMFFAMMAFPIFAYFLRVLGTLLRLNGPMEFFVDVIRQTLATRKAGDKSRNDFIQLMKNAQHGEKICNKEDEAELEVLETDANKKGLTDNEIIGNAFVFFLAGYDTTHVGLTQLLYCLACNPDCQEKVYRELNDVIGDKEDVDYDSIMKLQYLDMCLQESLRIYSPAPRLDRVTNQDTEVNGIPFKKGTLAIIPTYAIHHDPEIWPEPEKFIPERFTQEEKSKRNPIMWLPFGYGPRNCIAMRLAMYELKVGVVHILRNHKLVTCDKTEQPLVLSSKKWMKAENGVWLAIEKR